jgi:hypothetical protein
MVISTLRLTNFTWLTRIMQKLQLLADENVVKYLGSMETARNEIAAGEVSNEGFSDEDEFS